LEQSRILAEVSDRLGSSQINLTNRANIQIRGLKSSISPEILSKLQDVGLAAKLTDVDHLRNIMASPTAGIDPEQLIDTCPLVVELAEYLGNNPALAQLSPKFSVGIDGGERISIQQQPNDIFLKAVTQDYLQLYLAGIETKIIVSLEQCSAIVGAIAQVYLDLVPPQTTPKPRLKQIIKEIGRDNYLDRISSYFPSFTPFPTLRCSAATSLLETHRQLLGTHPQRQPNLYYIGVALPLGHLATSQLHQISNLAENYGSGSVRLTPWRSILLPDIQEVSIVQQQLEELGLSTPANHIWGGLVACSGTSGCVASATDTQGDALALAQYISEHLTLDRPITIHLTGCPKSCAHHGSSDLTLVGTKVENNGQHIPGYDLYGGDRETPFGQKLITNLLPTQLPQKIGQILSIYQLRRITPEQSFREFVNQYPLVQLHQWFNEGKS
jgi:ferredoxin-nitrite reductase